MKQHPYSALVESNLNAKDLWHIPWMEESVRNSLINQLPILESEVLI